MKGYKITVFTLSALIISVLSVTCLPVIFGSAADCTPSPPPKIIIDAGHGGFDGGAVASDGTVEKDLNLQIALRLAAILESFDFDVILTREGDGGLETADADTIRRKKVTDMHARLSIIEDNPDAVFISIHLNKFTSSSPKGTQVFYSVNDPDSEVLADCIQNSIRELIQPDNARQIKPGSSNTMLLYKAKIPAVIVECGFLSNPGELEMLKTSDYQTGLALAAAAGITDFLGVKNDGAEN